MLHSSNSTHPSPSKLTHKRKMANPLYNHQKSLSTTYNTTSRSAIDSYYTQPTASSRYLSTFSDSPSSSFFRTPPPSYAADDSLRFTSSADYPRLSAGTSGGGTASRSYIPTVTSSSLWPSFDVSSALHKRPSEALYDSPVLGAHMFGQNEAWFMSDSLSKRPRLESASDLPIYPQRPGEKDCTHYMLTRICKFGDNCKFDHPIWVPAGGIPDWKEPPSIAASESHPERPGEPDCPYFLKTQKCKYGLMCKFNHPKDKLDTSGKNTDDPDLPNRPSEPLCSFYMKTGKCKFGAACKFHHPKDIQVPSDGQDAGDGTHSIDLHGTAGDGNSVKTLTSNPASSYNSKGLPIRLDETDCPFYMKTGSCKYGINCRYNHPDRNVINPTGAMVGHGILPSLADFDAVANYNAGLVNPAASLLQSLHRGLAQSTFGQVPVMYPQRPGQVECDHYMKTGECKFGERCRFHHPINISATTRNQTLEQSVKFTLAGLPRREGVQHCPFYMKTSTCSYGANCKFDHPPPGEVMALAEKEEVMTLAEKEEVTAIVENETSSKDEEESTKKEQNVATPAE